MERRILSKSRLVFEALIIVAAGFAAGVCFWPGKFGWLFWFVFVPLLWITQGRGAKGAFLWGWLFGTTVWSVGVYWLVFPLSRFLNISFLQVLVLFAGICAYHGLMFAIFAGVTRALTPPLSKWLGGRSGIALFCAAVPAMASMEAVFPTLFPFHFATTQYFHLPTLQMIEIFGTAGMAWLLMGFNVSVYVAAKSLWERRQRSSPLPIGQFALLIVMCILAFLNEGYGRRRIRQVDELVKDRISRGRMLEVAMLQGAMPADLRIAYGFSELRHSVYRRLTERVLDEGVPDLIVWPESSYGRVLQYEIIEDAPLEPTVSGTSFERTLRKDIPYPVDMLLGSRGEVLGRRYNIAFLAGPGKKFLGLVQKRYLFPFGEYMPMGGVFPVLHKLSPRTDRLSRGGEPQPLSMSEGAKVGVIICYEDLYPEAARVFAKKGSEVLINVTNPVWFENGTAPEQLLMFGALRAIETRKFLLRAANNGISSVVDPAGRIIRRIPLGQRSFIKERVALMDCTTFHARSGRFFYHLSIGLFLAAAAVFIMERRRASRINIT